MNGSIYAISAFFALLAAMSPGPDFALVSKNSLLLSRRAGVYTAIGVALGLAIHVTYALLGFSVIIKESVVIYSIIKYLGAVYLAFLGTQLLLSCRKKSAVLCGVENVAGSVEEKKRSSTGACASGFLCNVLNPKATLFVLSFFSQIIDQGMSLSSQLIVGLEIVLITLLWFIILAMLFSHPKLREKFIRFQNPLSIVMGLFLLSFSIKLAFF